MFARLSFNFLSDGPFAICLVLSTPSLIPNTLDPLSDISVALTTRWRLFCVRISAEFRFDNASVRLPWGTSRAVGGAVEGGGAAGLWVLSSNGDCFVVGLCGGS